MKFLPSLFPFALVTLAMALSSCSTPANQRELYNTSYSNSGVWHDYERRREAEAETGVSGGNAPSVLPGNRGRATPQPRSSELPAGTTAAPTGTTVPAQITDSTNTGAPPAPVNPPTPAAVATPAPDVSAAPATTAPIPDASATTPAPDATPASP